MTTAFPADFAPRRIALFRALFLGDLLCATPAFRVLRRRFPRAEITLVALPWARELVDRLPTLDRFEEFPGHPELPDVPSDPDRTDAFLTRMRQTRFDLAIQLHGDGRISNGVVAAFAARSSIGFGTAGDTRLDEVVPWNDEEHEIRRWLRLMDALGADAGDPAIELPTTWVDRRQTRNLLARLPTGKGPVVGLHAGSKLPSRRWSPTRFAALGDALALRLGARILLTGGAQERDLVLTVANAMRSPALNLAGETDLGAFAALVARLDLLVTNDTGASHVAAATRTRSVVLFGPSRPGRWAPLDRSRHTAIDATAFVPAGVDPECSLSHLAVEPVFSACEAALAGRLGQPSTAATEVTWPA